MNFNKALTIIMGCRRLNILNSFLLTYLIFINCWTRETVGCTENSLAHVRHLNKHHKLFGNWIMKVTGISGPTLSGHKNVMLLCTGTGTGMKYRYFGTCTVPIVFVCRCHSCYFDTKFVPMLPVCRSFDRQVVLVIAWFTVLGASVTVDATLLFSWTDFIWIHQNLEALLEAFSCWIDIVWRH